jgi:predicted DNA-binding transcriptional regulator AlpA
VPGQTIAPPANDLITAHEVSEMTGLAVQTLSVWRLHGRYRLPYKKIGRLIRYSRRDVEAWIESRTRLSTSDTQLEPVAK